jgi:HPt (histidine-containing phosphotransfer) domain-containing protein
VNADLHERLRRRLDAMRPEYLQGLASRLAQLEQLRSLIEGGPSQEPCSALHRLAHSIAGSGATFGYSDLSARARALELLLATNAAGTIPSVHERAMLIACVAELVDCIRSVLASGVPSGSPPGGKP